MNYFASGFPCADRGSGVVLFGPRAAMFAAGFGGKNTRDEDPQPTNPGGALVRAVGGRRANSAAGGVPRRPIGCARQPALDGSQPCTKRDLVTVRPGVARAMMHSPGNKTARSRRSQAQERRNKHSTVVGSPVRPRRLHPPSRLGGRFHNCFKDGQEGCSTGRQGRRRQDPLLGPKGGWCYMLLC